MEVLYWVLGLLFAVLIGFFAGVKFVLRNPKTIAEFIARHQ